jgi:hypothetical protein
MPPRSGSTFQSLFPSALLLFAISFGLDAAYGKDSPLPPHSADYQLSRNGLPFATMTATLEQNGGRYRLEARTRAHKALSLINLGLEIAPNANQTEVSEGILKAGRYRPSRYSFRRENADRRELRISFDWASMRATINSDNQPWSMAIPPGAVDKLSVLLHMRQDLASGKRALSYSVADGGKLKNYRYRRTGRGEVRTQAGTWNVIELSRSKNGAATDYRLRVAPERDHLPVLVEREEDGSRFRMELVRIDQRQ